jgi:hypothetical protein
MRIERTLAVLGLFAVATLAACADEDSSALLGNRPGGPGSGTGPGGENAVETPPLGEESDLSLPRLTREEYVATLTDVLRETVPSSANELSTTAARAAQAMPDDQLVSPPSERHGGFSRLDQSQQQAYADVPVQIAAQLGKSLTSTPARIAELVGTCSNGGANVDRACLEAFVRRFGALTARRPLGDDDVAFYVGQAPATNVPAETIAGIVTRLLSSPRFLYRVESGTESAGAPDIYALDAWELASRLSYHFWGTMPDPQLREAAKSGALLTSQGYAAEVDRLYADPRSEKAFESFFTQWFWPLLELPALDSRLGDATFRAFAGANAPSSELRAKMVREVVDASVFIAKNGGKVRDLLTNRQSFARDPELAAIYGIPAWNGVGVPPTLPVERVGLLTRPAFLTTGTANTRPVMKGVFIRTTLLCQQIPPPPQDGMNVAINLSPTQSTRQMVEQVTESSPSCAGCHKSLINPLGFASEGFDALGRTRKTQTLFDATGKVVGQAPLDTTGVPAVVGGDTRTASGIGQVTEYIAESGLVEACFAQRYFRFTFRRLESTTGDSALVDLLTKSAREGKSLADTFKSTALRPEFKRRRLLP